MVTTNLKFIELIDQFPSIYPDEAMMIFTMSSGDHAGSLGFLLSPVSPKEGDFEDSENILYFLNFENFFN